MAVDVHVVELGRTINAQTQQETNVVKESETVPNSAGNPTLEEFLIAEAADDFLPVKEVRNLLLLANITQL